MDTKIIDKYSNKEIGRSAYAGGLTYTVDQLINPEQLHSILWELFEHEGHLTEDGFAFLEEYYGLENLASLLKKMKGFDENYKDEKSILDWLKSEQLESKEHFKSNS